MFPRGSVVDTHWICIDKRLWLCGMEPSLSIWIGGFVVDLADSKRSLHFGNRLAQRIALRQCQRDSAWLSKQGHLVLSYPAFHHRLLFMHRARMVGSRRELLKIPSREPPSQPHRLADLRVDADPRHCVGRCVLVPRIEEGRAGHFDLCGRPGGCVRRSETGIPVRGRLAAFP